MTSIARASLIAALLAAPLAAPALAQPAAPAAAPAVANKFIAGLGIADTEQAVANTKAAQNALREQQIVYKNQAAMLEARQRQINAEIAPLVEKLNRDRQAGTVSQTDLQQQASRIQSLQQAGVQELQTMRAPIALSEQYVREQFNAVISRAITTAMERQGITLVLPPNLPLAFNNAYNLTPGITAELDRLLPTVRVVPPAGWQPGRAQAAQPAAPPVRAGNGGR
jgi:Skp family chaperone for outer membrane proteins